MNNLSVAMRGHRSPRSSKLICIAITLHRLCGRSLHALRCSSGANAKSNSWFLELIFCASDRPLQNKLNQNTILNKLIRGARHVLLLGVTKIFIFGAPIQCAPPNFWVNDQKFLLQPIFYQKFQLEYINFLKPFMCFVSNICANQHS